MNRVARPSAGPAVPRAPSRSVPLGDTSYYLVPASLSTLPREPAEVDFERRSRTVTPPTGTDQSVEVGEGRGPLRVSPLPFALPFDELAGGGTADRDRGGRFASGNAAALVHGRRSATHLQALSAAARDAMTTRRAEITSDLGGALSTLQADILERYLVASALLGWMEDRLLSEGVITAKGQKRALFGAYALQLDRVVRLATTLGLERRARPVPTLAQTLARRAGESR